MFKPVKNRLNNTWLHAAQQNRLWEHRKVGIYQQQVKILIYHHQKIVWTLFVTKRKDQVTWETYANIFKLRKNKFI